MKQKLIDFYITYKESCYNITQWAAINGLTYYTCDRAVNLGRKLYRKQQTKL